MAGKKIADYSAEDMAAAAGLPNAEMPMPKESYADVESALLSQDEQARMAQIHMEIAQNAQLAEAKYLADSKDRTNQILVHRVIDPHEPVRLQTVIHQWVNITPSICCEPDCGYDAAKAHGFVNGWDAIPPVMQYDSKRTVRQFVLETLGKHKAIRHQTVEPKHIRTAVQAKKAKEQRQHQIPGGFITNPNL